MMETVNAERSSGDGEPAEQDHVSEATVRVGMYSDSGQIFTGTHYVYTRVCV